MPELSQQLSLMVLEAALAAGVLLALFQMLTYRQKYEALRALAERDPLTGVYNRGFFDEVLRAQLARTRRGAAP